MSLTVTFACSNRTSLITVSVLHFLLFRLSYDLKLTLGLGLFFMRSKIKKTISIGYLSERTGVTVSALRYYETENLLHPERNAGGQRQFLRADIRRVSFILVSQQFGFSIDQIKTELDRLPAGRTPTKRDWAKIGMHFGKVLDTKIETLQKMRDSLDTCIGCGCLSLKSCALYNPADKAATRGIGPRYLMGDRSEEI